MRLPDELQHWNIINVEDGWQVEQLWTHLRFAQSVINQYLNTFVFSSHCRQFSRKLQVSAWDLPLFTPRVRSKTHSKVDGGGEPHHGMTTGFSGTNDNKAMLPLNIKQIDIPGFGQTNAEVLTYLLQRRNRRYVCASGHGGRWNEEMLVRSLQQLNIRVLIDAGAHILEKTNEALARAWLGVVDPLQIKAAVYFDENDNRAWVVFRDKSANKTPLVSTPYAGDLSGCVVYFDDAHTRGVDLQLPPYATGAVTLALGQTKDHTVQGKIFFLLLLSSRMCSNNFLIRRSRHEASAAGLHPVGRILRATGG